MSDFEYSNLTKQRKAYVDGIVEHGVALGINLSKDTFCRAELRQISMSMKGKKWIPNWITHEHTRRAGVGVFHLPEVSEKYTADSETATSEIRPNESNTVIEENGQAKWANNMLRDRLEAEINAEVDCEEISW
jgi:hypothetical protein